MLSHYHQNVAGVSSRYTCGVPKLWAETVESHREEVRTAVLDAVELLVANRGVLGVTMSQLAETTGIGRATLYKYFGDVEEVLTAWHHRHVAGHLAELRGLAERSGEPAARLRTVLEAYGRICQQRGQHGADALVAALHHGEQIESHEQELRNLLSTLLTDAAASGAVRKDVPPDELANYCINALAAAGGTTVTATDRLVSVVLMGLTPPAADRVPGSRS
jgi:AcrR family transcriptional regulator